MTLLVVPTSLLYFQQSDLADNKTDEINSVQLMEGAKKHLET